jgi:hypothetical protein
MLAASAVLLGVFAVQGQAAWQEMITWANDTRAEFPRDLRWIERSGRPVAVLSDAFDAPQMRLLDYYNDNITAVFVQGGVFPEAAQVGAACGYAVGPAGVLVLERACGGVQHRLLLQDTHTRWRFYDERSSVREASMGRIVQLDPQRPPRLQARLTLPCATPAVSIREARDDLAQLPASAPRACFPTVQMWFWLEHPARVTLWFRGTDRTHQASVGSARYRIPAGRMTPISVELPAGESQVRVDLDWATTTGPRVVKAQIRTGGVTRSLIY